jgi:long-subunit acyl-CoA synthetase (AMP-forming)
VVLMPTSGSTGVPQLVMVSHGNLRANTEAIVRSQRLGSDEKAMLIMPVSYCFGASVMHSHLYQVVELCSTRGSCSLPKSCAR